MRVQISLKNLLRKGYKNLIEIKDDQTKSFKEFEITLYKPFTKHIYEESYWEI